jgi:protein SCO1/2
MLRIIFFIFVLSTAGVTAVADNLLPRDSDYDYDPPAPGSYNLPVVKVAPDGALLDSNGRSLNLRDLTHGRVTVLSFIYTRCAAPKACPYATGVLSQLNRVSLEDDTLTKSMRLVSLSFDPEYDTPQRLAAYSEGVRDQESGCEWRFATAKSRPELESILDAYGQAVDKRQNPADPQGPLYHTLRVFLIDREGRIRNIYSSGTLDPRLIIADVKTLLLEESRVSKQ